MLVAVTLRRTTVEEVEIVVESDTLFDGANLAIIESREGFEMPDWLTRERTEKVIQVKLEDSENPYVSLPPSSRQE